MTFLVFVETTDQGAGIGHLVGPDGKTLGIFIKPSPGEAVESACSMLKVMGRPDEARTIERHWAASHSEATS